MKIRIALLFLSMLVSAFVGAQSADEKELIEWQQKTDDAVVACDMAFLNKAYTDDFRFRHSTGLRDTKETWLRDVEKSKGDFISRTHADVEAEIHGDIGITEGKLTVKRKSKNYYLRYVRVYIKKNGGWQMLMHRSVAELTE